MIYIIYIKLINIKKKLEAFKKKKESKAKLIDKIAKEKKVI